MKMQQERDKRGREGQRGAKPGLQSAWQNAFAICADAVSIIQDETGKRLKRGREERFFGPHWLFGCLSAALQEETNAAQLPGDQHVQTEACIKNRERMRDKTGNKWASAPAYTQAHTCTYTCRQTHLYTKTDQKAHDYTQLSASCFSVTLCLSQTEPDRGTETKENKYINY